MIDDAKVREWMSSPPITIKIDTSLSTANTLIKEYSIRRLPVLDTKDNLVGILTVGDIRRASPSDASSLSVWEMHYLWDKLKVGRVMTKAPQTIAVDATVIDAAEVMLEHKVSGLPVLDADGKLCGIITESDIFRMLVKSRVEAG